MGKCDLPELPDNFVPRPAEFEAVKALLCTDGGRVAVAITTAMQGTCGYGKTTFAAAVARDRLALERLGRCYWITPGKELG